LVNSFYGNYTWKSEDVAMMAVRYHRCTCHQRYSGQHQLQTPSALKDTSNCKKENDDNFPSLYSAIKPGAGLDSYSRFAPASCRGEMLAAANGSNGRAPAMDDDEGSEEGLEGSKDEEGKPPQPWYFHVVASLILVVHGLTFLVPHDPDGEDTDMVSVTHHAMCDSNPWYFPA